MRRSNEGEPRWLKGGNEEGERRDNFHLKLFLSEPESTKFSLTLNNSCTDGQHEAQIFITACMLNTRDGGTSPLITELLMITGSPTGAPHIHSEFTPEAPL